MNINLSYREKMLVLATIMALGFFVYWSFLLGPLLDSSSNRTLEIDQLKFRIEQTKLKTSSVSSLLAQDKAVKFYNKDKQLKLVIDFIDKKFTEQSIKLLSLNQSGDADTLFIDIECIAGYGNLLKLFQSFKESGTLIIVDNFVVSQYENKLKVKMRLLTAYL